MLNYEDLDENEKQKLKDYFHIGRMSRFYLEDNNILLMKKQELFEYIYLDEIEKYKEAIEFIKMISALEIPQCSEEKTVSGILLERNDKVIKLSNNTYAYKDI